MSSSRNAQTRAAAHLSVNYQCITCPPSTLIVCPVTFRARSDDRNTTISAISSVSCQRPNGATARTFSPAHSSYDRFFPSGCCAFQARHTFSFNGVFTIPGFTVFTRTPCGARSFAKHCAKLIFAALLAEYGGSVWDPICPAIDAINTIVPAFRATIPAAHACATCTIPITFTSITRRQSAGSKFVNGKPNFPDPIAAACTTCPTGPNRASVSASARCTAA